MTLQGIHIVSLALNLPGPAALMRLRDMGATCTKVGWGTDPMALYNQEAFDAMHRGLAQRQINLKSPEGPAELDELLRSADVLVTSFRAQALRKLGLNAEALSERHPHLSSVAVFGSLGDGADDAGHDLTYQAQHGLLTGMNLPSTLMADMAGALCVSEAVLKVTLARARTAPDVWRGQHLHVGLSESVAFMALPKTWGLTARGAVLGGLHAGYQVYAAADGRVAFAPLEPHFWVNWCRAVGWLNAAESPPSPTEPEQAGRVAALLRTQPCAHWQALAQQHDIPLHVLPD